MRKFLASLIAISSYLIFAPPASAALIDCAKVDPPFNAICSLGTTDVPRFIGAAISFIFVIAVIVAIFYLLLGGLKWIYSGGDKAAVESARGTITAAVIGLVVIFLVFLLFTVILGFFDISILEIELPSIIGGGGGGGGGTCVAAGGHIPSSTSCSGCCTGRCGFLSAGGATCQL